VGVSGIWNDMNEPSVFKEADTPMPERTMPDSVRHGHKDAEVPHRRAHNLYGFQMSQSTREGLLALQPEKRPFVITRAGYAGVQRHAMVWTGDNHSMWSHLEASVPMCLNLGLSGVAFTGPDVGGFQGDCTPELLVRWLQAGVAFPFYRNHSAINTRRQEPWAFGPDTERLAASAIAWRYRLLPYLYGLFREAAETGLPIMRPMALTFPHDPNCRPLFDQFMLGDSVLAAPVVRPGVDTRTVYFPAGRWEHLETGEVEVGPGFRVVAAPIDRLILYVREGAALPLGPVVQHTGETVETLRLVLGQGARWAGSFYDDDGATHAHLDGAYSLWRFEGGLDAGAARLTIAPEASGFVGSVRSLEVSLPWSGPVGPVRFDGSAIEARREGDRLVALVPLRAGELAIARN
jgi:alpha-glucosidase